MARDILDFATLQDDAVAVVEAVVSKQLDGKAFRASKVADWCTQVAEAAVADLRGLTEVCATRCADECSDGATDDMLAT